MGMLMVPEFLPPDDRYWLKWSLHNPRDRGASLHPGNEHDMLTMTLAGTLREPVGP